jgi:hypothetical protein
MFSEIKKEINEVVKNFSFMKKTMGKLEHWNSWSEIKRNFGIIYDFLHQCGIVVYLVGERAEEVMNDERIQDELAEYLDNHIKLPFLFERFDKIIFRLLIEIGTTAVKRYMAKNAQFFSTTREALSVADTIAKEMDVTGE